MPGSGGGSSLPGSGGGSSLPGSGGGSSLPGSGGGSSLPGSGGGAIEAIASFGSGVAENVLVNTVGSFLKFGGSSVPSGNTSNITAIERKVNMTHYKEYVVTNKEAFDAMEALADELGTNTFATFIQINLQLVIIVIIMTFIIIIINLLMLFSKN